MYYHDELVVMQADEDPRRVCVCGGGPDRLAGLLTVITTEPDYPLSIAAGMCQWGPWQLLP